jgi:LPS sulfotransferase NodH
VQEHHNRQVREVLKKSERVTFVEVSYPELVADPGPVIAKLAEILKDSPANGTSATITELMSSS